MLRLLLLGIGAIFLVQACQNLPSSKPRSDTKPFSFDQASPPPGSPPASPPAAPPDPPADPPPTSPPAPPTGPVPGASPATPPAAVFADRVIGYQPVGAQGWLAAGNPALAIGAPGGPLDTVPLGFDPNSAATPGGSIVLGLGFAGTPYCITDGAGADFVVFSSSVPWVDPLDGAGTWNQVMTVEVSNDGAIWYKFLYQVDLSKPLVRPARYQLLAGVNATVGTGAGAQGGDAFDLADIQFLPSNFEACYVRITDAGTVVQDYGNTQPASDSNVPYSWNEGGAVDAIRATSIIARPGIP
jgi:hypothetical protein